MNFDYKRLIKFEHNIGDKDKKIRLYSGIFLLAVSLFTGTVLFFLVGCALVATSFFGWCPAYSGFNHKTTCCATPPQTAPQSKDSDAPEADNQE